MDLIVNKPSNNSFGFESSFRKKKRMLNGTEGSVDSNPLIISKVEENKNEHFHENIQFKEQLNNNKSKFSTSYLEKINEDTQSRYEQTDSKLNMNINHNHRLAKVQIKMKKALETTKFADSNAQVPGSFFNHKILSPYDQFSISRNKIDFKNEFKTLNVNERSLKLSSLQQFLPQKAEEKEGGKVSIKEEDNKDNIIDSFVIKTKTGKHPDESENKPK